MTRITKDNWYEWFFWSSVVSLFISTAIFVDMSFWVIKLFAQDPYFWKSLGDLFR